MKRDGVEVDESLVKTIEDVDKQLTGLLKALGKISPAPEGYEWGMGHDGKLHIYPIQ